MEGPFHEGKKKSPATESEREKVTGDRGARGNGDHIDQSVESATAPTY